MAWEITIKLVVSCVVVAVVVEHLVEIVTKRGRVEVEIIEIVLAVVAMEHGRVYVVTGHELHDHVLEHDRIKVGHVQIEVGTHGLNELIEEALHGDRVHVGKATHHRITLHIIRAIELLAVVAIVSVIEVVGLVVVWKVIGIARHDWRLIEGIVRIVVRLHLGFIMVVLAAIAIRWIVHGHVLTGAIKA